MIAYKTAEDVWAQGELIPSDSFILSSMTFRQLLFLRLITSHMSLLRSGEVSAAMKALPGQTINGQAIEARKVNQHRPMRSVDRVIGCFRGPIGVPPKRKHQQRPRPLELCEPLDEQDRWTRGKRQQLLLQKLECSLSCMRRD